MSYRHPWPAWFARLEAEKELVLVRRVDFRDVEPKGMRMQVYAEARRRDVRVSVKIRADTLTVRGLAKRRTAYPWAKWLAPQEGVPLTLLRGREFHCTTTAIQQLITGSARRRGLRVKTQSIQRWPAGRLVESVRITLLPALPSRDPGQDEHDAYLEWEQQAGILAVLQGVPAGEMRAWEDFVQEFQRAGLDLPTSARAFSPVLKAAGWTQHRTAKQRLWKAP